MVSILLASASERRRDILSEIVNETVQLESRALASNEINPSSGIEVSERVELICSAKAEAAAQEIEQQRQEALKTLEQQVDTLSRQILEKLLGPELVK